MVRIETLKNLSAFRRRTCAGDGPRFVSAVLELHCTSASGEQWIRLWSNGSSVGRKKGRTENMSRNLPGTWMPATHGVSVGFASPGEIKGIHERTYTYDNGLSSSSRRTMWGLARTHLNTWHAGLKALSGSRFVRTELGSSSPT